ncbi:DUF707 domain-containing protein [Neobacillus sp. LXY-4]|uniref:DUF707 domain-containing protein n=1 Tax=Neobacillus sp. LXY-4 TaxID=3379826 RepID=UPI003EE10904
MANVIKPIKYTGKKRFLVMARVGDSSLHKEWLKPKEHKNFDLYLEYFGDGSNDYKSNCQFYAEAKETKWPRFYRVMKEYGDEIFKYDAVWMPDDDIYTNCSDINKMFKIFKRYKLALAQPALTNDSYYSHPITLRKSKYFLRYTKFVEVMVPIFSRDALKLCWRSFKKSKSGWGLDSIWPKLLGYPDNKIAIIDEIGVKHTRAVGGGTLYQDIQGSAYQELDRICKEYGVTEQFDFNVYGKIRKGEEK